MFSALVAHISTLRGQNLNLFFCFIYFCIPFLIYLILHYIFHFFFHKNLIPITGATKVDTEALYRQVIRDVVVPPLHHLGVRALRSQFPSYTAAVKLMHSWAAQHYFTGTYSY